MNSGSMARICATVTSPRMMTSNALSSSRGNLPAPAAGWSPATQRRSIDMRRVLRQRVDEELRLERPAAIDEQHREALF